MEIDKDELFHTIPATCPPSLAFAWIFQNFDVFEVFEALQTFLGLFCGTFDSQTPVDRRWVPPWIPCLAIWLLERRSVPTVWVCRGKYSREKKPLMGSFWLPN